MANTFETAHGTFPISDAMQEHAELVASHTGAVTQEAADRLRKAVAANVDRRQAAHEEADKADPDPEGNSLILGTERRALRAADRVYDLHTQAAALRGDTLEQHGFMQLDQVHGLRHERNCGCARHMLFDHYDRAAGVKPHRVLKTCAAHAHLADDPAAHHAAITAEDQEAAELASGE